MENVKVEEVTMNVVTNDHVIYVIDNRVHLYKGRELVSSEEHGSYDKAKEVAAKMQKDYNGAKCIVTAPSMSEKQRKKIVHAALVKSAKKAQKEINKSKEENMKEQEEIAKKLALLALLGE